MVTLSRCSLMTLTVAVMPLIYACSDGVSKSELTSAINKEIGEQRSCFSLVNNNVRWPTRVSRSQGIGIMSEPLDPILSAMRAAGYLKIATTQGGRDQLFQPTVIDT